jgi:hypothetical protein
MARHSSACLWHGNGAVRQPKARWMAAVTFICPMTDLGVQYWLDDDEDIPESEYEAMFCPACAKIHLINRKTGKPLAKKDTQPSRAH